MFIDVLQVIRSEEQGRGWSSRHTFTLAFARDIEESIASTIIQSLVPEIIVSAFMQACYLNS